MARAGATIINSGLGNVGDTKQSMLTELQFQSFHGTGWILADGRDVTGSKYHTVTGVAVVPDMRGVVLRGKNNGRADGSENPDGDLALGAFQNQQTDAHSHSRTNAVVTGSGVGGNGGSWVTGYGTRNTSSVGGNETRMRNVTVNIFIKVN